MTKIYYRDKKLKNRLYILETDIITFFKNWFDVSSFKDAFFTGHVPNDHLCACLTIIILMGCIDFETPCTIKTIPSPIRVLSMGQIDLFVNYVY